MLPSSAGQGSYHTFPKQVPHASSFCHLPISSPSLSLSLPTQRASLVSQSGIFICLFALQYPASPVVLSVRRGRQRAAPWRMEKGPVPDSLRVCITDWALIKSEASISALPVLPPEENGGMNGGMRAKGWCSDTRFIPTGLRGAATLTSEHPSAFISTSHIKCQKSWQNEDEER